MEKLILSDTPLITSKQLLSWLEKNEITNLEQFAEQAASTLGPVQVRAMQQQILTDAVPVTSAMVKKAFWNIDEPQAKQGALPIPFRVEGTVFDSTDIHRFDGKVLHFYIDNSLLDAGYIDAFTSNAALQQHLQSIGQITVNPEAHSVTEGISLLHHIPGSPAQFFEHINFGGRRIDLSPRHAFWNLTQHTLSGWWFWRTSWNDQISSIRTGSEVIRCFEHIHLTGRSFTVGRNTSLPWVGNFWNDRISSAIGSFF